MTEDGDKAFWDLFLPWRPMNEAPKDGRSFIAWYQEMWTTTGNRIPERYAVTYWGRANDLDGYSAIGWVDQGRVGVLSEPSFWQPLPSSPESIRAARKAEKP